jgi:hypothetical protein
VSALEFAREYLAALRSGERECFAAVVDFSYQHYALGDALTTQVHVACLAREAASPAIDLYLVAEPMFPAAPGQSHIKRENYCAHLDRLFPAFLCLPQTRSIRIMRDAAAMGLAWTTIVASGTPHWPSLSAHLRAHMQYPMAHDVINRVYQRDGNLPQLDAPRGYGDWARQFLRRHWPERFVVCINPRQSRFGAVPATTYRDAPLEDWHAFIDAVAEREPRVQFLMLGGFDEWDRSLGRRRNVAIPRTMGLTLAHELALLRHADLFMGTSSGFATMATFTDVPYVIVDIEPSFAPWGGIEAGVPRYPFAHPNQHLIWKKEDTALLLEYFEAVYRARP